MNDEQDPASPPTGWQFRPDETIAPGQAAAPQPQSSALPSTAPAEAGQLPSQAQVPTTTPQQINASVPHPMPAVVPSAPATPPAETIANSTSPASLPPQQPQQFAYNAEDDTFMSEEQRVNQGGEIAWSASEFISHHKNAAWYVSLAIGAFLGAGVVYLVTKDIISGVSILLIAFVFGLAAARKPRVLNYRLDDHGVQIGQRSFPYAAFRSFAIVDEGAFSSIALMPLKRFMPIMTIYYEPADEEQIVQTLAARLPLEERKLDAIDNLMHKIRF